MCTNMSLEDLIKNATVSDLFSDIPDDEKKELHLKGKIAAAITNKRYELNMNQNEFAKKMGVSQTMVSKWESGDYNFTCDSLEKLLSKIGFTLSIEAKNIINYKSIYKSKVNKSKYSFFSSNRPFHYVSAISVPSITKKISHYSNSKNFAYSTI